MKNTPSRGLKKKVSSSPTPENSKLEVDGEERKISK